VVFHYPTRLEHHFQTPRGKSHGAGAAACLPAGGSLLTSALHHGQALAYCPQMCFQAAIANGSNLLLLITEKEIDINEELEASVSRLLLESDSQMDASIE
jgi:hypothetical protein